MLVSHYLFANILTGVKNHRVAGPEQADSSGMTELTELTESQDLCVCTAVLSQLQSAVLVRS